MTDRRGFLAAVASIAAGLATYLFPSKRAEAKGDDLPDRSIFSHVIQDTVYANETVVFEPNTLVIGCTFLRCGVVTGKGCGAVNCLFVDCEEWCGGEGFALAIGNHIHVGVPSVFGRKREDAVVPDHVEWRSVPIWEEANANLPPLTIRGYTMDS